MQNIDREPLICTQFTKQIVCPFYIFVCFRDFKGGPSDLGAKILQIPKNHPYTPKAFWFSFTEPR